MTVGERIISVVPRKCIGAGNCVDLAEDYFDQRDDDATIVVLRDRVPEADLERVRRAANACPVVAILIEEPGEPPVSG